MIFNGTGQLLRRTWDRTTIYLPVLFMILLALGTYWLVRSAPLFAIAAPEKEVRRDPDYEMTRFSVKTFDGEGRLKSEIYGEQAWHYPYNDTLEIHGVRMRSYNIERGYSTVATAQRALTNSDASEVELIGKAQVLRDATIDKQGVALPRVSFRSEYLHAYLNDDRVLSNKPVELIHDESRIEAQSLNYSNYDQVLELHGRVRGVLLPRASAPDRPSPPRPAASAE